MKKLVFLFLIGSLSIITSCKKETNINTPIIETNNQDPNAGTQYKVDLKNSIVNWSGSKPLKEHVGTINLKEGIINIKDDSIITGRFFLDMNTITVTDLKAGDGKEDLETHLKGTGENEKKDHFFNVKKYPTSEFKIVNVSSKNGKKIIYGNLGIKGVVKAVNFPASIDVTDNSISIISDTLRLNRTYWNVTYASNSIFSNLGDKFINDEIKVQVNIKANR